MTNMDKNHQKPFKNHRFSPTSLQDSTLSELDSTLEALLEVQIQGSHARGRRGAEDEAAAAVEAKARLQRLVGRHLPRALKPVENSVRNA